MRFRLLILGIAALLLAACGTVAETNPTFEPTNTGQPRLVSADEDEEEVEAIAEESTAEATEEVAVVPTATLEPTVEPTIPPTEVPTLEPTEEAVATEEVVEDASDEGGAVTVVIDGAEYVGDATFGKDTFEFVPNIETQQTCRTCHNPDEPVHGVGPYLYGIATVAGERVEGMDAVEYLHESIVNPNAHMAPPQVGPEGQEVPWPEGLMPQSWGEQLEAQQIADLVAYLMSLNQELPE